ncbi:alpha-glucan family phosphorylase [Thermomonospora catenispora]|uniref:alpha-glucan family phosphorylase n=1 Tax=Thermomonospora catenispora TaxID=2493090 RepID=UPI001120CE58|nr:alpha-glucan family phosphorylase [Thermomonospora catenispora]TNY38548.1 glycosyltransferase family 1 protein [Thermomonospora catenispora]
MKAIRRFTVRTVLPERLRGLEELVGNLRWSWHHETLELFRSIDPALWESVRHDPVRLLGEVPPDRLAVLAEDRRFLRRLDAALDDLRDYLTGPRWYQSAVNEDAPRAIAYFSPEYGITAALPQYSGGLGILAGDHLKTASDLGVPIIGVGLLYRHGYFSQSLSPDGWQQEHYPAIDPGGLPLTLLREPDDGTPVRVAVGLPEGRTLHAQIWLARVGRVPLLLLDSDVEANDQAARNVTDRLYGGGTDHRLLQELLLGIGGVRAIRAYCRISGHPSPEVFHTNEGHAGFLGLERIRELIDEHGLSFDEALEAVRAGTVFTTHTPVPAGIDRFPRELIGKYFGGSAALEGVPVDRVLALGEETYPDGDRTVFNMAVMGMRLGQRVNGVSRLHGRVSREMFGGLWGGFDVAEVPIGSITNGVHAETWVAPEMLDLAVRETASGPDEGGWDGVLSVPEAEIWRVRRLLRERLVLEARRRLRESWRQRGASEAETAWIDDALDPDVLTIGFARRVPSYKRLTLMLRDPERLRALLLDPERPVQIVIAGKAHPADEGGKRLIQDIVRFADREDVRHRIVFLPDYDMALAQVMVAGCDVWMNNPLRPLEACGTSGMKAALNGGLNLSVRDGWWDEWFDGRNGWAIPSADGLSDPDRRDRLEAAALYELIGDHVTVLFYDRDASGLPRRWLEMVKHTLATLGPKVLATRMLRDYVHGLYAPAAASARAMAVDDYAGARELAAWKAKVLKAWPGVTIDHVESVGEDSPQVGACLNVRAVVSLGDLTPGDVAVEAVYGRVDESDAIVSPSYAELTAEGPEGGRVRYVGDIPLDRSGPFGYSIRVIPRHPLLASRTELGLAVLPPSPSGMTDGDFR